LDGLHEVLEGSWNLGEGERIEEEQEGRREELLGQDQAQGLTKASCTAPQRHVAVASSSLDHLIVLDLALFSEEY
jgi:hypothetical protein